MHWGVPVLSPRCESDVFPPPKYARPLEIDAASLSTCSRASSEISTRASAGAVLAIFTRSLAVSRNAISPAVFSPYEIKFFS